jgi:hypothetical protein
MPLFEAAPVSIDPSGRPSTQDLFLPVPFVSQRPYSNLSWAACGAMVLNYNDVYTSLSDIASKLLRTDCSNMPPSCDKAVSPQDMYKTYGFAFHILEAPLRPLSMRACIANMQPV